MLKNIPQYCLVCCVVLLQSGLQCSPHPAPPRVWRAGRRWIADPQSNSYSGLEFHLAACVPVNSCTAPRRHGRITHQPEDAPYGGFGSSLPCCPPLSHGSSRFEVDFSSTSEEQAVCCASLRSKEPQPAQLLPACTSTSAPAESRRNCL